MRPNIYVFTLVFLSVVFSQPVIGAKDKLTEEEIEILENLEFFENFDILEEDAEIIDQWPDLGEEDEKKSS